MRFETMVLVLGLATAAACAVDDKDDASQLPAELGVDVKADSVRSPSDGGAMLIGRYEHGAFTASQGWIGYEIELTGAPVDVMLHGQQPGNGDPLDTIVYVFGPKKPNGKYPVQAVAFNDDEEPGVSLGSHIYFTPPAQGTYRVVVSTYYNWLRYPKNVSRGDYHLIVKCPGDFGSCGPAAQFEGGACFSDDECVDFTHCEGEVTCAPGTQCLYVRQGTCTENYEWLTYGPKQCGQNPWQVQSFPGDDQPSGLSDEALAVDNWLESQGIQVREVGFLSFAEPRAFCAACNCPRGDTLLVKASWYDAERLRTQLGFTKVEPGQMRDVLPVQCNGNPWQTFAPEATVETDKIIAWLADGSAWADLIGFTNKAEVSYVCKACSCARGDRLVVSAKNAAEALAQESLGFVDLYKP